MIAEETISDMCIPVVGGFVQNDWDKALCTIISDLSRLRVAVTFDIVEAIVSAFYDLQIEDPNVAQINYRTENADQVRQQLQMKLRIATQAAQPIDITDDVLQTMYWASESGRISPRIAFPRQFHWKRGDPRSEDSSLVKYAKTALYVVLGAGTLYGLYKASQIASAVSQLSPNKSESSP